MTFSKYFSMPLSAASEILAAHVVYAGWENREQCISLAPQTEQATMRLLLTALEEMPAQKSRRLAELTLASRTFEVKR